LGDEGEGIGRHGLRAGDNDCACIEHLQGIGPEKPCVCD